MPDVGGNNTVPSEPSYENNDAGKKPTAPYEGLLSEIVARIRDQPFLFVIAIAALLVGAVVLGAKLGSSDLRFVITVIALLAVIVIAGYYVREGMRMTAGTRKVGEPEEQHPAPGGEQQIEVTSGAELDGALQEASGVGSQSIVAKGKGTSVKDVIQTSTDGSSDRGKQDG
jgi:hypothetical protein